MKADHGSPRDVAYDVLLASGAAGVRRKTRCQLYTTKAIPMQEYKLLITSYELRNRGKSAGVASSE
jgi:hypothetical protein